MKASADCEVVRRLVEEVANQSRMILIDDLVSADFREHAGPPGLPSDREVLKQALASRRLFGSGSDYAISELRAREGLVVLDSGGAQRRPESRLGGNSHHSRGARQDCRALGSRAPVRHSHSMTTSTKSWKLSPSDFAFLWEECKRCFYLKVARGFYRPRTPFPGIFSVIDRLMNEYFNGRPNAEISETLPPGLVKYGESWVESRPIALPGRASTCFIRGRFDSVLEFEDGSYGIIDFKTTSTQSDHLPLYTRQLHAYTYALERAAPGNLALSPITRLGLVCVEPDELVRDAQGRISYTGNVEWKEMPRDDAAFDAFLGEVVTLLDLPEPPAPGRRCEFCRYRTAARKMPH